MRPIGPAPMTIVTPPSSKPSFGMRGADGDACEYHTERYTGIGRHVEECTANIEIVMPTAEEEQGSGRVNDHTDGRDDDHGRAG